MFPAFLAQYAAGCFLAVAASDIRRCGPRYLRLMAVVALAVAVLAGALLLREGGWSIATLRSPAAMLLASGVVLGAVWLFVNAAQFAGVRNSQRLWPLLAGMACMAGAVALTLASAAAPDAAGGTIGDPAPRDLSTGQMATLAVSTILGGALLGTATAAMLLGHRYLTDTDLPIDPLRWITRIYLWVIAARAAWALFATWPAWSAAFAPSGGPLYFWLALTVRLGVGIGVACIFAWMVWDCVKRRATQSATALYYLSMLLVVIGEAAAQYLMQTERMAS